MASVAPPSNRSRAPFAAPAALLSGRANMRQLVTLRWLAVVGQFVTIMLVHTVMGVPLPVDQMLAIVIGLVALNLLSTFRLQGRHEVGNTELFLALLVDVIALAGLLYLSGGAKNPFIWLFLVQVVLGAIMLDNWSSWGIVLATSACFVFLLVTHLPLELPHYWDFSPFDLYFVGALTSFLLIALLLVAFVTRISANMRAGDARLAAMRQHAAEEDLIVRMGMLATGAAHELGTPLASLSVIANDWSHRQELLAVPDLAEEIEDVRVAVERCKTIVGGILTSAGEVRGEKPSITTLDKFLASVAGEWCERAGADALRFENRIEEDVAIISDTAFRQVIWNVLDNAAEASGTTVVFIAERNGGQLILTVRDRGPGFPEEFLDDFGKPYRSTKPHEGGGLGLFLVVNVMRKMGGTVVARNEMYGGACVVLTLPLSAIEWSEGEAE